MAAAAPVHAASEDLRLQVARQWAEKGDYDKAIQELRLFLNEHPDAAEVYARIGTLQLRQEKIKLAESSFRSALAKDPNLAEAKDGLERIRTLDSRPVLAPAPAPTPNSDGRPAPVKGPTGPPHSAPAAQPQSAGTEGEGIEDAPGQGAPKGIYALAEFQEALRLYREKQPDAALAALKRTLAKSPGHPGAYYLGGVIRYERGELAKADFNFKRSFDYPERGFNAHFYLARIYQKQDRDAEAIASFQAYLKSTGSESGRKQAEKFLAQLQGHGAAPSSGDGGGNAASVPGGQSDPHPADAGHGKGAEGGTRGDHTAGHGDPPVRNAHGAKDAHGDVSADSGHQGHSTPALPAVPSGPKVLTKDGYLPFVVADSSGASGKMLVDAYEAFKRESYDKASEILKDVIRQYGGSPNAEAAGLDLAAVYVRLGLHDNARDRILDYLSKAKDPAGYRDLAFYLEGLMHLGKKDGEKAERALLKVKAGGPGGPAQEEIDWRLAQAGELMKDPKKWAAYLEKAQAGAADPLRKARLLQKQGWLHGHHGRPVRALEQYRKSMTVCGKPTGGGSEADSVLAAHCAESQLRIADLEFRRKDWKAALAEYRKFSDANPGHPESAWVQYQIANIHQATRKLETALNEYQKVIDNYPDSYWASQAKWKREDAIWRKEYEEVLD